ncbi:TVP38/TMEM64 family protein [uncultured Ilyobacter sp.]|uniref:TVP38/TMEM64 family protein n=1 Tax=uncultured Ilyobacter sp. TaxID=544433 RepID=UPI0029F48189|nr:TVP38/TMEM64 family protein [uncultured Ilyobacter sp.]
MKNKKGTTILIAFLIVIFVLYKGGVFDYISLENIKELKNWINSFGVLGPLVYIALYIVACIFFLPGLPITVLGGVVFGPLMGTVYTVIGAGLGMSSAFLVARYLFRESIERKFSDSLIFQKIDQGVKNQGWRILMTTRLVPIFPFNVQNYVYGLTGISFLQYSILSTIFIIPGTAAYTLSAGAIASGEGISAKNLTYLGVAALCFIFISLIPKLLEKKKDQN